MDQALFAGLKVREPLMQHRYRYICMCSSVPRTDIYIIHSCIIKQRRYISYTYWYPLILSLSLVQLQNTIFSVGDKSSIRERWGPRPSGQRNTVANIVQFSLLFILNKSHLKFYVYDSIIFYFKKHFWHSKVGFSLFFHQCLTTGRRTEVVADRATYKK